MRICRRCGKWFKGTHYETLYQQCRPDPAEAVDWDKVKAETDKVIYDREHEYDWLTKDFEVGDTPVPGGTMLGPDPELWPDDPT